MYDLAVIGAGIVGLAHATIAARAGLKVVVLDRDENSQGASVRNFGLVTVTGQSAGATWDRAKRSAEIWGELALEADIPILQRGMMVGAFRDEAVAVLEAYRATALGQECSVISGDEARERFPMVSGALKAALWSPHEIRVEARDVIPRLTEWLVEKYAVTVKRPVEVFSVMPGRLETSEGPIDARYSVVCPGDDPGDLYLEHFDQYRVGATKLHMMRLSDPGWRADAAFMSDLTLVRYRGFSSLVQARPLKHLLEAERAKALGYGIHLIVTQSADGTLVVGDSHHDLDEDIDGADVESVILDEARALLDLGKCEPIAHWTGTYATSPDRDALIDTPDSDVRLVVVTSGSGMSTSFAIAEDVIRDLIGSDVLKTG